jgi:hypothetical protein
MDTTSLMHFFASLILPFIKKYMKTYGYHFAYAFFCFAYPSLYKKYMKIPRIKGKGS